jgi:hypothetical protein
MTQDRPTSDIPPTETSSAAASRLQSLVNPGRRMLLGGIPIAVTLASQPALARTAQCSVSNALSGNLSHPLPSGVNCGMTPLTWCNLAGTNQLWPRTAMYPQTTFSSACGGPGFSSGWVLGTQSLLSSLQGSLSIQCKINGKDTTLNAQLFGEHVSAAMLNAAAFSPNNFPKSLGQVQLAVRAIWQIKPTSQSQAQSALDGVTNQYAPLNINT